MISFEASGSFKDTARFLEKLSNLNIRPILESCGDRGVKALSSVTPVETGLAARSWSYEITESAGVYTLTWLNHDVENGFPVAIMLQYGHGTGTGGYVPGIDFINPAIKPIFDDIAKQVWKAVNSA